MLILASLFRDCIDEDYIKTLFASTGGGVQNFRFFQYVPVLEIDTVQKQFVVMKKATPN